MYKKILYIPQNADFKIKLLEPAHSSPWGGHSGYYKSIQRVRRDFLWPDLKIDVKEFIRDCDFCQRVKASNIHPHGLLQPLPIPTQPWAHITMNFVGGLPISMGFTTSGCGWWVYQIQPLNTSKAPIPNMEKQGKKKKITLPARRRKWNQIWGRGKWNQ